MFDPLQWKMTFEAAARFSPTSAWVEHIPFGMGLVEMMRPDVIVELGTQRGDSYCAFCQAVSSLGLPTKCFGIDTWADDKEMHLTTEQMLVELHSYHDERYQKFSTLIQTKFDDALSRFEAGQIDLLHIDGMHDYESVRHDFEMWLPKMSSRGVILFHDSAVRNRPNFGVWRLWEEISGKYPSFEFLHGYGLGVLAVGDHAPPEISSFIERANQSPEAVRRFYHTMGHRTTLMRVIGLQISAMMDQRRCMAQWRELTKQPAQPVVTFDEAGRDVVKFASTTAHDSLNVINDDLQLRAYIAQLTEQMQQLQQQAQTLASENRRLQANRRE